MMVHPDSHRVSRALWYLGTSLGCTTNFAYRGITFCARAFQLLRLPAYNPVMRAPQPLPYMYSRFRLFRVRSPLLTESRLISLPRGTEMFHFPRFALHTYVFSMRFYHFHGRGFPHSDIPGSKLARQLPGTFRSRPRPSSLTSAKALAVCPL